MRRYLLFLVFVLAICFASSVEARKLALLVGVDEYEYVPSLRCCVNDMKALKEALVNVGFVESDIQVLVTGGSVRDLPTKRKIEQKVSDILAAAQPDDIVFFAFSGHGAREGKTDYFCPPFADPDNLKGTCVSITKVMNDLSKCEARFKWMVVDACRNAPNGSRDAKAFQVIPAPPAGIALFQSCDKDEKSYEENREGGHGYFTKNLVAALSGSADTNRDGRLTLLEVCTWTSTQTQAEVEKAENKTQRPFLNLSASDFTIIENRNVTKADALAEKARKAMDEDNYELAVELFDEALKLCPQDKAIKRERDSAKRALDAENRVKKAEEELQRKEKEERLRKEEERQRKAEEERQRREEEERQRKIEEGKQNLSNPGSYAGERKTVIVNGIQFSFRWCPAGSFMMGSPISESGRGNSEKQHQVNLTNGFWMLETEVTVGMFREFISETDYVLNGETRGYVNGEWQQSSRLSWRNPGFSQDDDHPVTCVSWFDAMAFCKWLSRKTGQNITLPTEAQWEYACRAGSETALPNGPIVIRGACNAPALDPIAWYSGNSSRGFVGYSEVDSSAWTDTQYRGGPCGTHPVGTKSPNEWGLYDMLGNVWEWCTDWYGAYPSGTVTDPTGSSSGSGRVNRGGGWHSRASNCRSAHRDSDTPGSRYVGLGFRCVTY